MPIIVRSCNGMSMDEIKAKVKEAGRPVLLKFSSERCAPCEDLKEKLAQYETDLQVNIFDLCRTRTASYVELWDKFYITAFPTIVLVDEDMNEMQSSEDSAGQAGPYRMSGSNIKKFDELIKRHKHLFE
ncbi:similarity to THIOREDOXIN H type [Encephalitozoon cuniculi GB-M1]|uniref:Similarity to THIOREDOXIN H type n=2 Tax=Encephalitozoon cuniculi TaxID=6035 RepID=Q8SWK5_ENCCU|nr:thioredoxin-like protein [Encephalitozoon cuniculi GB-M1]KMV66746.1 thioredoxin-like protein [Encephalitozoon cuniculi EcunIII-L]UYI28462.1 thioredoxin [Encephalitozoon cuniculi]CAD24963.2 similarity to THIOREDOXIN H type [Encephalitozoon cuniculi GB-M1]